MRLRKTSVSNQRSSIAFSKYDYIEVTSSIKGFFFDDQIQDVAEFTASDLCLDEIDEAIFLTFYDYEVNN